MSTGLYPKANFYKEEKSQWHRILLVKRILGLGPGVNKCSVKGQRVRFLALCARDFRSNCSLCCGSAEAAVDDNKQTGTAVCPRNCIYKNKQLAGFGPRARVCQPLL